MISTIKLTILGTASFLLVFFGAFFFIRLLNKFKNLEKGFFHLMPYIILLVFALGTISSGRDLSAGMYSVLESKEGVVGWVSWVQRLTTLILLLASLERIVNGFIHKRFNQTDFWPWFSVLFIFWFTTVFTAAVFSDHPQLSHEYFYPLIFFIATLLLTEQDKTAFLYATRNALIGFILFSWLFALIKPSLVFEFDFSQGFIPGVPRFAGIAPHAVTFASLVIMLAIFLFSMPLRNIVFNRFLWVLILLSLFLAQSKTMWVMGILFLLVYIVHREGQTNFVRGKISKKLILQFIPIAVLAILIPAFYITFMGVEQLLTQDKIDQLSSLTGRDVIWGTILSDSKFNSIFGYGPNYFGDVRSSTGMLFMTHGHNQFFDTLAKAGEVGVFGLLTITLYLIYQLIKVFFVKNSVIAVFIFLYLFIRSISGIPLTMFGYSIDIVFLISLVILLSVFRFPVGQMNRKI